MWTNASLPRPSATWMQIVSIPLGLFGADAGLVTKAMERIASVSSLWNCSFLRWRYLTSVTTGIHFVFSLSFPLRLKKEAITLICIRKQKTTNWRILVVGVKWRHRMIVCDIFSLMWFSHYGMLFSFRSRRYLWWSDMWPEQHMCSNSAWKSRSTVRLFRWLDRRWKELYW